MFDEIIESYINGNIGWVKSEICENSISLGDLFEHYVENYNPTIDDMVLFVKRLG